MKKLGFFLGLLLVSSQAFAYKITIDLPDDLKTQIVDGFCKTYNYPEKIKDPNGNETDNPVSKDDFTKNVIISFTKEVVKAAKANEAAETARKQAAQAVDAAVDTTKIKVETV